MGVYIGDVYIPFVSNFTVDKSAKPTEQIKHLGNVPAHIAEFQADVLSTAMSGTLFKAAGDVRTVDQYAEDITALVERFGVYNYLNSYQGRSGWMVLESGDTDKSAESVLIRDYAMSGKFMPKNKYQPRMHTTPVILANDFSLTLGAGGCDNYVPLPIGASYSGGDGSTITRVGADGTNTLVLANTLNDVKWDMAADEVDVGECKCWDTVNSVTEADWVRVFNPDHVFIGKVVIENGLIRTILDETTSMWGSGSPYYSYTGAAYVSGSSTGLNILYGAATDYTLNNIHITSLNSEEVIIIADLENYAEVEFVLNRGTHSIMIYGTPNIGYTGQYDTGFPASGFDFGYNDGIVGDALISTLIPSPLNDFMIGFKKNSTVLYISSNVSADQVNTSVNDAWLYKILTATKTSMGIFSAIPFTCANLFKECEAMTQGTGVTFYTGADASPKTGNTGSILDAQYESVYLNAWPTVAGTYKMFIRAKDSAQVANDIQFGAGEDGVSWVSYGSTLTTLTSSWAYYTADITIPTGITIMEVRIRKETTTANIIDLDYVLWVPITLESGNGPQDIAHQAMVNSRLKRELVAR